MGSKKKPFYRIVATDSRNPRDGRFIETLGYYNPLTDPPEIKVDEEGVLKWLERGAVPSDNTESILRRTGAMQKWQLLKQGVKREDLDAKLEEMGIETAPPAPSVVTPAPKVEKEEKAEAAPVVREEPSETTDPETGKSES